MALIFTWVANNLGYKSVAYSFSILVARLSTAVFQQVVLYGIVFPGAQTITVEFSL